MGIETALIIGALAVGGAVATVAMKAKFKAPSASEMDRGIELSRKLDADYPREVAVGLFSTGGSGAYDCVSGEKGKYLYRVSILSDYEITKFRELWLDGEKMTLSGDPMQGWVNVTGRYQLGGEDVTPGPAIRLRVMSGTEGQSLEPELATAVPNDANGDPELASTDRFAGLAYAILRFESNPEAFQGGEPQAFFVGEGAPVHDPRDANSDPADPSTWSRTSDARFNAALVAAQAMRGWARNGEIIVGAEGLHLFDIPETQLEDAADICDEDRATPDGVEPRYRVGGMVRMDPEQGIRPSLEKLIAAMDGELIEDGGEFILLPGAPRSLVATYDLQAIGGRCVRFDPYGGSTQRKNGCECTFVDPEAAYGEQTLPLYRPQAYLDADDGRPNTMRIGLELCPYRYQAASIQKSKLDRQRLVGEASFDLPLIAKELQPGDWFGVTDEVTGQVASVWEADRVARVNSRDRGARVLVDATEIAVTPYVFNTANAEAAEGIITAPPERTYEEPGIPVLTLSPVYVEGGGAKEPAIQVVATVPESPLEPNIDYEWRQKAEPDRLYARTMEKARGGFLIREGVVPSQVFEVRARLSSAQRKGDWSAWREVTAPSEYSVPAVGDFDLARLQALLDLAIQTNKDSTLAFVQWGIEEARQRQGVDRKAVNLYTLERTERITADTAVQTTLETQISAVEDSVAAVQTEVTTNASAIAAETTTRSTQFSSLSGSLATANTLISTNVTNISALSTRADTLEAQVFEADGVTPRLATVTDVSAVSADVDSLLATRLITAQAGAAYAGVQFSALQTDDEQASEIRFAGQVLAYGATFTNPRRFFDAQNNEEYVLNAAGTVKTIQFDWDTGDFWFRDAAGNILLDKNGVTANGLGAVGSTQAASGSGTSGTLANSPSWTDVCSATIATAPASGVMRVTGRIKGNSSNAALAGDWRVILRKTGETDVVVDSGDWEVRRFEYDNSPDPIIVAYGGSYVSISGSVATPFGGSVTAILQANKPASTGTFTATGAINFERTP